MPNTTVRATAEGLPKMPANIAAKYTGNEPVDELDYACDILRVARVALQSPDMGDISRHDITAAGNCIAYAIEALDLIRPFINKLNGRTRA